MLRGSALRSPSPLGWLLHQAPRSRGRAGNVIHKMRFYNQYEFEKSAIDRGIERVFKSIHSSLEVLDSIKADRAIKDSENINNQSFSRDIIRLKERHLVRHLESLDSNFKHGTFKVNQVRDQFVQLSEEYGRVVDIDELFTKYNI